MGTLEIENTTGHNNFLTPSSILTKTCVLKFFKSELKHYFFREYSFLSDPSA